MENFIVSARKYRPSSFQMVVGQKHITTTLKNAIKNNHLAQAFLFTGPRGVGKTTCARIFAKTINCTNLTKDFEACNECEHCRSFNESSSFNIHELDAASNNAVDDIRALIEQVRIPPQAGKYKVYIIDEVHMLSQAAFNAFLKTLEEPPAYAKFILATTEKHKIIPTILSRCQIYDFHRITIDDIALHLEYIAKSENVEADPEALYLIAEKADGALRDALSVFDQIVNFAENKITYDAVIQNLHVLDYDYFFRMTEFFLKPDVFSSLHLFNEILQEGFSGQNFLSGLSSHFRNLLICKDPNTLELLEVGNKVKQRYSEQANNCNPVFLLQALTVTNTTEFNYRSAQNKRLQVELALMQICGIDLESPDGSINAKKHLAQPAKQVAQKIKTKEVSPLPTFTPVIEEKKKVDLPPEIKPKEAQLNEQAKKKIETKKEEDKPKKNLVSSDPFAGMFSVQNAKKQAEKKVLKKLNIDYDAPDVLINLEELKEAITEYANKISVIQSAFSTTLKAFEPLLNEKNEVTIIIQNSILESHENKANLLNYIKKKLNNKQINIYMKVDESGDTLIEKGLTSKEKLEKMREKNPYIGRIVENLRLELE